MLILTKFEHVNLHIKALLQIKAEYCLPEFAISYWVDPVTDTKFRLRVWAHELIEDSAEDIAEAIESRVAEALQPKSVKYGLRLPRLKNKK